MRSVVALLLASFAGFGAHQRLKVEDLLLTTSAWLNTDHDDDAIAQELKHVELTERLSDPVCELLKRDGAGPKTLKALRKLEQRSASLPAPSKPVVISTPRPSNQEVHQIFEHIVNFVAAYVHGVVDFTCTADTRLYSKGSREVERILQERGLGSPSFVENSQWELSKTVIQHVSYFRGRESYRILEINGKRQRDSKPQLHVNAWSSGEFVGTMRMTFAPLSKAQFQWDRWQVVHGKRVAVFTYAVDASHSHFSIGTNRLIAGVWVRETLMSAYRGLVYADPQSGVIVRLVAKATSIPNDYSIEEGNSILNYSDVEISGHGYPLLTSSTAYIRTKQYRSLIKKTFTDYRKFQADSRLVPSDSTGPNPKRAMKSAQ